MTRFIYFQYSHYYWKTPGVLFLVLLFFMSSCMDVKKQPDSTAGTITGTTNIDPLPSWNEGPLKTNILNFVTESIDSSGENFIPVEDRVAVFDNDGTLWSEQPVYFQFFFAMDQVRGMAATHPAWSKTEPYKSVINHDLKSLMAQGEKGLMKILGTSHSGMNSTEFENMVTKWIDTAVHPLEKKKYKDLVFLPMIELIRFLQDHDYTVYIVSGGETAFMRPWVTEAYGIPRDRVIGSNLKLEFQWQGDEPVLMRLPAVEFNDDGVGKPMSIDRIIGRKPVAAFGNSDGDLPMLQWTASNPKYKSLMMIVHHTDSTREFAYDRESKIGRLDKALDWAKEHQWYLMDMQKDWKVVYKP